MNIEIISAFKDEIIKHAETQLDEIRQSLDDGLNEYTIGWRDKINKVKTYLFDENPVTFEDVYVPLNLKVGSTVIDIPEKIDTLFRGSHCLSILGHAGSGKTMLMKHSFLKALDNGSYIPIIIELRRLDVLHLSLSEYISSVVFKLHLAKNKSIFARMMSQGRFMFFLDGYDEISLDSKEERTNEIEELVDAYAKNLYWLSSRPGAGAENLERFRSYHVCDMNDRQVELFVRKQILKTDEDGDVIANNILSAIHNAGNSTIFAYLHNPLLLSMFILTYRYNPEIPKRKSDFYYNVFDTLYIKHDTRSKSGGYLHDRKCKFEKDQYLQVLRYFSFLSFFNGKYLFDTSYLNRKLSEIKSKYNLSFDNDNMIYDLSVSIAIFVKDGLEYSFPHRSMQEYFAADLISTLQDKVKKDLIYKEVLKKNYGSDGYNFWSLCEELDELCFQSYFLNKYLKEYEKILIKEREDTNNPIHKVFLNMCELSGVVLNVDIRVVHSIRYSTSLHDAVSKYVLRYNNLLESFFKWSEKYINEVETMWNLVGQENVFAVEITPLEEPYKSYLLKTHLPDMVYERFKMLKEKIATLDNNIKSKKLQEEDLINLL